MANDYIRREDAVDAVCTEWCGNAHDAHCDACAEVRRIKALPSADVAPVRHGRWIKVGVWGRVYKCNQCGNFLDFDGVNAGRGAANFCPNCGAKMDARGEE